MTSKTCFNSECNASTFDTCKKGWRLRNDIDFALLCHRCGSIYDEGRFCEIFHKYASGWRCCEACGKRVHCGCIVSIHAFVVLDAGGIECMVCARKNVNLTPKQTCPPRPSPGWLTQSSVRKWSQNVNPASTGFWHFGENVLESADCLNSRSSTSFEVDMSAEFDKLLLSDPGAAFQPERIQTQKLSFTNRILEHNGSENPGYVRAAVTVEEEPCSCHMHPLHQSSLKDGQCKQSELAFSSPLANQTDNKARDCFELSQQLNPLGIAGKQLGVSSPNVDSSHQSQLCNFKPLDLRVWKGSLAQYCPKISNEGSQQLSESAHSVVTPLFEKRLSTSDVGRLGRLVVPKKYAETHFPPISEPEGLPLEVQDIDGREWTFNFRFWLNNNSRIYVMEGIKNCMQSLQLQAGDTVSFGRREPEGKLILGFKKASRGLQSDQGNLALEGEEQMDTGCDAGNMKPKCKEDLTKCHSKVNKATGRSSSIQVKRKNCMMNSERRNSNVDNMDFIGPKITLEEAQGLFRSPLNHAPRVVEIEDFEFEEFEDAPVIGWPTIIVRDSPGKDLQWTQCNNCQKWRKLPLDSLLPARFTCAGNIWDPERSSCEAAQEPAVKQLKDLLSVNYAEPSQAAGSKMLLDAELDAHASEDVIAHENSASEGYHEVVGPASTQPTTKHPRHKDGCNCVVCCQSPSGGPRHQQNCSCKVCMMLKRRLHTLMIRREKNQFKRESVVQGSKSQVIAQLSEKSNPTQLENSKESVHAGRKISIASTKGRIDLNAQPEREQDASKCCNSMALTKMKQDASQRIVAP